MKLLVRVLPASVYTSNMVPNIGSGWSKPTRSGLMVLSGHGQWLCSQIPLSWGSRTSEAGLWSGAGLTRNWVSHTIIGTSDSLGLPRTHSELPGLGLSPEMLPKVHGPVPWTNPFTIRPFSGVPHYYWDVGLLWTPSDSLGITRTWAISRNTPKSTRSCTLGKSVHY